MDPIGNNLSDQRTLPPPVNQPPMQQTAAPQVDDDCPDDTPQAEAQGQGCAGAAAAPAADSSEDEF